MPAPAAFQTTFNALRALLKPYERQFVVIVDKPGKYYLSTKTSKTVSGAAIWFGGAEIKKTGILSFAIIDAPISIDIRTFGDAVHIRIESELEAPYIKADIVRLIEIRLSHKNGGVPFFCFFKIGDVIDTGA